MRHSWLTKFGVICLNQLAQQQQQAEQNSAEVRGSSPTMHRRHTRTHAHLYSTHTVHTRISVVHSTIGNVHTPVVVVHTPIGICAYRHCTGIVGVGRNMGGKDVECYG